MLIVVLQFVSATARANVAPQSMELASEGGVRQAVKKRIHHARRFREHRRENVPLEMESLIFNGYRRALTRPSLWEDNFR